MEDWRQRDPIERLRHWMEGNHLLTPDEAAAIDTGILTEIDAAVAFAEAGTLEPVDQLERFVLMDSVVQEAQK
jgi:TPP-dependent pyruvate/acetoin dehydrogenase alpha subunit